MIADDLFKECLVILEDINLLEEDRTERVSSLIASKTSLTGNALNNETLDVLWRHREKTSPTATPPMRHSHTIIRRPSPAPWQFPRVGTPTPSLGGTPPTAPPGFPASFLSNGSPFPSPRPSPRLAYNSPLIPHSPNLNNYEPMFGNDTTLPPEPYGDFGSDTVEWLVNDETYGAVQENMSPHDMLRSVLGEGRTDEEIGQALEECGYDLGATLTMLMEQAAGRHAGNYPSESATVIGKSTTPIPSFARPATPRNGVVCRFFLSNGQCLRADCRFSHELGTTICKYWVMGSCLAGDTCIFSHDPTMSVSKMTLDAHSRNSTPPPAQLQFHDSTAFPSLWPEQQWGPVANQGNHIPPPPGFKLPTSRPHSRQQFREREQTLTPIPHVDDTEAFPSLGSAKAAAHSKKRESRRHRNDATNNAPVGPSSLAEVVRMNPSTSPHSQRNSSPARWSGAGGSPSAKRSNRASAANILSPQQIPWLETGSALNRIYFKHRKEAIAHGVLRAKYLQLANTAWQRNDSKSAKEHSRKANNENIAMTKAHKEAAKAIYEERNKNAGQNVELFVDLHGLLPDEACKYLEDVLVEHQNSSRTLYAIVGTGHHSKGNKDKLGKAIRAFLDEWRYAYKEFSVTGDRNSQGGILGIDPASFDKSLLGGTSVGLESSGDLATGGSSGASSSSSGGGLRTTRATSGGSAGTLTPAKEPPKGPGNKKK
ncbi:hypothetical protein RUND412_010638 [Rhizina undulata]